jgi:hypothetical protein
MLPFFTNHLFHTVTTHPALFSFMKTFLLPLTTISLLTSTTFSFSFFDLLFFIELYLSFFILIRLSNNNIGDSYTPILQGLSVNQRCFVITHKIMFHKLIRLMLKLTHISSRQSRILPKVVIKLCLIITSEVDRIKLFPREMIEPLIQIDRKLVDFILSNSKSIYWNLPAMTMPLYQKLFGLVAFSEYSNQCSRSSKPLKECQLSSRVGIYDGIMSRE